MIPVHAQALLDEIGKTKYKPRGSDKSLIDSAKKCIALNKKLSSGQEKWLLDIYKRATGGGSYVWSQII